jgi:phosphoglycerate dehydrogenase-like enzyme
LETTSGEALLAFHALSVDVPPRGRKRRRHRVLITPHVSSGRDEDRHGGVDVFCDNLRVYRDGKPLCNVIDWKRGY